MGFNISFAYYPSGGLHRIMSIAMHVAIVYEPTVRSVGGSVAGWHLR
jgi:hypothetical protein